jgi:AcrR family transcriptional regulator
VTAVHRPKPQAARRTQAERRAHTIHKLTEATLLSLLQLGYARTTVKEICRRAELSDGALFRHFPTLLDLIIAAAEEVARRQITEFETRFTAADDGAQPLATALAVLRDVCRSKTNIVLNELLVAARTDTTLRRKLVPGIDAYQAAIRAASLRVPGIDAVPVELRDAVIFGATHLFDREALLHEIHPEPEAEEARLALLQRYAATLHSSRRRSSRPRAVGPEEAPAKRRRGGGGGGGGAA